jgi:hydrogenase maturation factor
MAKTYKSWEWVVVIGNGGYTMKKADEETRKKQLEEYKKRRKTELMEEIHKLDLLT